MISMPPSPCTPIVIPSIVKLKVSRLAFIIVTCHIHSVICIRQIFIDLSTVTPPATARIPSRGFRSQTNLLADLLYPLSRYCVKRAEHINEKSPVVMTRLSFCSSLLTLRSAFLKLNLGSNQSRMCGTLINRSAAGL